MITFVGRKEIGLQAHWKSCCAKSALEIPKSDVQLMYFPWSVDDIKSTSPYQLGGSFNQKVHQISERKIYIFSRSRLQYSHYARCPVDSLTVRDHGARVCRALVSLFSIIFSVLYPICILLCILQRYRHCVNGCRSWPWKT
jgi:hypothetical protein